MSLFGPSAAGTSSPAEGLDTAGPAETTACPAPGANPARAGGSAPNREPALISRQEHEAWDVLLACQGQLRLAPSGHVIGIDMNAALRVATVRGCDLAVLSELLPAAEAGVIEVLSTDRAPSSGL